MRAHIGTLVALDAKFRLPFRNIYGNSPLLILCCPLREGPVFTSNEGGYGKVIPLE